MNRGEFRRLVAEALDDIPEEFARHLENVTVVVEPDGETFRFRKATPAAVAS